MAIVIDGTNFINQVMKYHIDNDLIVDGLSFDRIKARINQATFSSLGLTEKHDFLDFVCSKKQIGPRERFLTGDQQERLLERIMATPGCHVEEVDLPGNTEKGVDTTVAMKMDLYLEEQSTLVLISEDIDFVPVIKRMRDKSKKVVTIKMSKTFPKHLINESFAVIDLGVIIDELFDYSFRHYSIKNMDESACRNMIANIQPYIYYKLAVHENGSIDIYQSGRQFDSNVQFFYELNKNEIGNVGPRGASSKENMQKIFESLKSKYEAGYKGDVRDIFI